MPIIPSNHGVYLKRTCTEQEVPLIFAPPPHGKKKKEEENIRLCLEITLKAISFSLAVSGSGK